MRHQEETRCKQL